MATTEFNTYPTTTHGVYGNGEETYFVNQYGRAFCVQSPDLVNVADALEVDNRLPVDCVALGDADCADLEIPDWVLTVGAPASGNLHRYDDAAILRPATSEELERSLAAAKLDGGVGAIDVDGVTCYVQGE